MFKRNCTGKRVFFHICLAENMLGFLVSQSMAAIILRRNDENNEMIDIYIYIYYIHISISLEYWIYIYIYICVRLDIYIYWTSSGFPSYAFKRTPRSTSSKTSWTAQQCSAPRSGSRYPSCLQTWQRGFIRWKTLGNWWLNKKISRDRWERTWLVGGFTITSWKILVNGKDYPMYHWK